jgi:copper(I)-binding protein
MIRTLAVLALVLTAVPALAQPKARVDVEQAWARATPGASTEGVVYLRIVNHGPAADRLVGARTPVAASASVHETKMQNGMMTMRPLASLPLPPGRTVALTPGHDHIMLVGLTHSLKRGDSFPLTLRFATAGEVQVSVKVESAGAMHMDMKHMNMGGGTMGGMQMGH